MPLERVREILDYRSSHQREGWWSGPTWAIHEALAESNLTLSEWKAKSLEDRYEVLARHRAKRIMEAWASLDRKERTKAVWLYREKERRKKRAG